MPRSAQQQTNGFEVTNRQRLTAALEASLSRIDDWAIWAKMASWTEDEAAALSCSLSPEALARHSRIHHPFIVRFRAVREIIRRACAAGDIESSPHGIKPAVYCKWAVQNGIDMPEALVAEVSRCQALTANGPKDKPLLSRERDTLLKIVIGMAMGGYGYDPAANRSSTVKEIHDDLALRGISMDQDTIRNKLREAAHLFAEEQRSAS